MSATMKDFAVFSQHDVKALLHALPSAPPFIELLSGTGIITEKLLRAELSRLILDSPELPGRTSVFELAEDLSVEAEAVERLLPAQQETWARIGAAIIVRPHELGRLRREVDAELDNDIVHVSTFCKTHSIDVKLFRRLPTVAYQWIGSDRDSISGAPFLARLRSRALELLTKIDGPVALSELFQFPPAFIHMVVAPLVKEGRLDGNCANGRYVPNSYIRAQQDALVERLRLEGVLELEVLRNEGVQDPIRFVGERVSGSRLLETHFVTEEYVEDIRKQVSQGVSAQMWANLKFLDTRLTPGDISSLIKTLNAPPDTPLELIGSSHVISPLLLPSLTANCTEFAHSFAEKAFAANKLAPPPVLRTQDLSERLSTTLPRPLATHFLPTLHPLTVSALSSHLESLALAEITNAKHSFAEKHYSRLLVHSTAISDLTDKSLKSKLSSDLLTSYVREAILPALSSLSQLTVPGAEECRQRLATVETPSDAIGHLAEFLGSDATPSEAAVLAKKDVIVEDLRKQMDASSDPSLVVLIACLLLLASSGSPGGVLKASGKYVPKLLKELKRKKGGVVGKEVLEVLERVKGGIVAGTGAAEEDVLMLKRIGKEVGSGM